MHPVPLLAVTCLSMLVLLFQFSIDAALLILLLNTLYWSQAGMSAKRFFTVAATMPTLASCVFILNLLHPAAGCTITSAMESWARLSLLSTISVLAAWSIDFHKLLYYLMSTNKLRPSVGYPILAAVNAIGLLRRENEKISTVIKLRELRRRHIFTRYFLLLVFAVRHSQRVAISLVSRGLNDHKTYIKLYAVPAQDWRAITPFMLLFVVLEAAKLLSQVLS